MTGIFTAGPSARAPGGIPGGQAHLLARHFFRRFLDNDLLSPNGETPPSLSLTLAFLAVPGLWMMVGLIFAYQNPATPPSERMLMALGHKYQFMACSMIVMALATVVQWDALALDRRDRAALGPLPIGPRAMLGGKLLALLFFLSAFAAAVNAAPTVLFPFIWLSLLPLGIGHGAWLVLVHAATSLAAAACAFFAVLAIRGVLVHVAGPRLFRRASTMVQFIAVVGLVTLFLLLPALSARAVATLEHAPARARLSPPMWFVGAYETLTARRILDDPDLYLPTAWRFWLPEREARARAKYLAFEPALHDLAGLAAINLAVLAAVGLGLFVLEYSRFRGWQADVAGRRPRWSGAGGGSLARLSRALIVRDPRARASFFFSLQALRRSPRHRLYVAGYLAAGFAIAVAMARPALARGGVDADGFPALGMLAVQPLLLFCLATGLRFALEVPAELKANWVFRVTDGTCACGEAERRGRARDRARLAAGVSRALVFGVFAPFLLLAAVLHAAFWGWTVAAFHFAVGLLLSAGLVELMLLGFHKVPFTCSYLPGKGNLRLVWPVYLLVFALLTWLVAAVELLVIRQGSGQLAVIGILAAILVVASLLRVRASARAPLVFDEEPEPAAQALTLGQ